MSNQKARGCGKLGTQTVGFRQKIKSFFSEPIHPQLLVNLDFVRKKHSLS